MLSFLIFALFQTTSPALAQEADPPGGYRFQAPRPPPLDSQEIDEIDEEDDFEMGDEGSGIPPGGPPPMPPAAAPTPGFAGPSERTYGGPPSKDGKLRFQIVEGEFWEKGKKRERGDRRSR